LILWINDRQKARLLEKQRAKGQLAAKTAAKPSPFWSGCGVVGFWLAVVILPVTKWQTVDPIGQWSAVATLVFGTLLGLLIVVPNLRYRKLKLQRERFRQWAVPRLVNADSPIVRPPSPTAGNPSHSQDAAARPAGIVHAMLVTAFIGVPVLLFWLSRRGVPIGPLIAPIFVGGLFCFLAANYGSALLRAHSSNRMFAQAFTKDLETAIAVLEAEKDRCDGINLICNNLAQLYVRKGDWAKALELIDTQLEKTPQFLLVHCNRAHCLMHLGRLEEAEREYRAAGLELAHDAFHLINYAELLVELGRWDDAALLLTEAQTVLDESGGLSGEVRRTRADEIGRLRRRLPSSVVENERHSHR